MDFIKTIYSDDDEQVEADAPEEDDNGMDEEEFEVTDPNKNNFFEDDFGEKPSELYEQKKMTVIKDETKTTLKQKIKRALKAKRKEKLALGLPTDEAKKMMEEESEDSEEKEDVTEVVEEEKVKKPEIKFSSGKKEWSDLDQCKPLQKAVQDLGYDKPTMVQEMTIPAIITGRDVLASSITGSGKTAAFLLPLMQKVWKQNYNSSSQKYSKVLIILPTRELALQCSDMFAGQNKYTKLTSTVIIGKVSAVEQETELRKGPDFIIATPGRLIDLTKNTRDFGIDDIECLIFDEADKLLELGFKAEVQNIVDLTTSASRQTLLFSATLGKDVLKIVKISLNKPLRIQANPDNRVSEKLRQEVVKIKNREDRMAVLVYLQEKYFKKRTIVFFKMKSECHRAAIILGLKNKMNVSELHGNLTQTERIDALADFKSGKCDILLASDLVARGLDIKNVKYVLNYELPHELTRYIHRVGRTARAGEAGVCLTIVDPYELQKLKGVVKSTKEKLFVRPVSDGMIKEIDNEILELDADVTNIYRQERFERELRQAEKEAERVRNQLEFSQDIYNRPKKEWIISSKGKQLIKDEAKLEIEGIAGENPYGEGFKYVKPDKKDVKKIEKKPIVSNKSKSTKKPKNRNLTRKLNSKGVKKSRVGKNPKRG